MAVEIITKEDLNSFRMELLKDIQEILVKEVKPPKKWLKTGEVKKILQVSLGTLQTLRVNGTLRYTKIGGIVYYDSEHLQKMLDENASEPVKHKRMY